MPNYYPFSFKATIEAVDMFDASLTVISATILAYSIGGAADAIVGVLSGPDVDVFVTVTVECIDGSFSFMGSGLPATDRDSLTWEFDSLDAARTEWTGLQMEF